MVMRMRMMSRDRLSERGNRMVIKYSKDGFPLYQQPPYTWLEGHLLEKSANAPPVSIVHAPKEQPPAKAPDEIMQY